MMSGSPVVIGCTGGSGSRVLKMIFSEAGYFMGSNLNHAGDAQEFEPFLNEMINPVLSLLHSVNYDIGADLPKKYLSSIDELRGIIETYQEGVPATSTGWGWKCPRNLFILPFIKAACPQMRFIHLVRDGRDIVLSGNQNQAKKHYESFFGIPLKDPETVDIASSIRLWQGSTWGCAVGEGSFAGVLLSGWV